MKINFLGHSCFLIQGDKSVVTDPFSDIGYPLKRVDCDYVLSSHDHFDHSNINGVCYKTCVTCKDDAFLAKEIKLRAISSYHDSVSGAKRGINYIYQFEVDGVIFTHLGDLGQDFCEDLVKQIGYTDVLFIPVGGTYTIDCKQAVLYANAISPKIVVPMHFKTPRSNIDISGCEQFLKQFDNVEHVDLAFDLDKNTLPTTLQVVAFNGNNY